MIKWIKSLFGIYEEGYEYWVKLSDIKIQRNFKRNKIGKEKYKRKWRFYRESGFCESEIILDKDFTLVDGYSSYKIYQIAEGENTKVPVWFVD